MNIAENIKLQEALSSDLERKELYFNHTLSTAALFGLVVLPLIPGSLSFASIVAHFPALLGIHIWLAYAIAAFTAIGVEVLGLVVIKLALRMRKFNHKRAGYNVEPAPIAQGVAAAALYLGVVLALVVLLKVLPGLAVWALIPLACLGAIADWAFALQGDQSEREAELRRLVVAQQVKDEEAATIDRLTATVDRLAGDNQQLQESVKLAADRNADLTQQFDSERQALNNEIVKLSAQLDTLRSVQITPQASNIPVVNTSPAHLTPAQLDAGRQMAADAKQQGRVLRQQELLSILLTEFNGQPSDALNKSELAKRLNTTRQTIGSDIEQLIAQQRLAVNGHVAVL